ncbi:MAG: hypothetical protein LUE17_14770 [Planctomycetaceae bacterium]|nr:hypothetical protein [Planctomycetaceae bacterium]
MKKFLQSLCGTLLFLAFYCAFGNAGEGLTFAWSSPNMSNQFQVTLRDCVKKYCEEAGIRMLEADARGDAPN